MHERKIGNIFGFTGGNYAGNVYDQNYLAPTLNTMQGGCKQPLIIDEVKQLGFMDNGTCKHQSNTVYDENAVCPNITTIEGGGTQQIKILNQQTIVAMRGRNPDNPSDRTVGSPTEQRLEPNSQGICNTLTSVQKDNMVMESIKIKQATKDGYIECKVGGVADLSFPSSTTRRGRVQDNGDTCPTLMSGEQDICVIQKAGNIYRSGGQNGNVYSTDGISPTISSGVTNTKGNGGIGSSNAPKITTKIFKIRKLTPKECWRLMDFSDEDFEKAAEVNSNTQLYKQAGNSIVRNVLVAIIGQMLPGKEEVYKNI